MTCIAPSILTAIGMAHRTQPRSRCFSDTSRVQCSTDADVCQLQAVHLTIFLQLHHHWPINGIGVPRENYPISPTHQLFPNINAPIVAPIHQGTRTGFTYDAPKRVPAIGVTNGGQSSISTDPITLVPKIESNARESRKAPDNNRAHAGNTKNRHVSIATIQGTSLDRAHSKPIKTQFVTSSGSRRLVTGTAVRPGPLEDP